ncbi:hypothetical protein VPH35_135156 [Triticum aestivum]
MTLCKALMVSETSWMQLPPLMSLQEECAQGEWRVKVRSSVPLLTGRSRRTLSVHAGGVIYDDLLGTTPLETVRNTHSVHHWSPAVAGRTVAVAARLNHKTPQQRPTKLSRRGDGLEVNCSDSVNLAGDRKDPSTGSLPL